jgi:hypothetical protein
MNLWRKEDPNATKEKLHRKAEQNWLLGRVNCSSNNSFIQQNFRQHPSNYGGTIFNDQGIDRGLLTFQSDSMYSIFYKNFENQNVSKQTNKKQTLTALIVRRCKGLLILSYHKN